MPFPLIINDDPSRLVQVVMSGSVGTSGHNAKSDVVLIQSLLNNVPLTDGGPQRKLAVDGLCGPLTVAAIRRFQKVWTKIDDGRVDPCGPTITSLVKLLNGRSALPSNLPNLGPPAPDFARALTGYGAPAPPYPGGGGIVDRAGLQPVSSPSNSLVGGPFGYVGRTGWDFVTSSSIELSGPVGRVGVGATVINIVLIHDTEPGTYKFTFSGLGASLSTLPWGASGSTQNMPSFGSSVWKPNAFLGKAPPLAASDLLLPTCIISAGVAGAVLGGWSGAIVYWGSPGPITWLASYINTMTGALVGTLNVGLTFWVGSVVRVTR